MNPHPHLHRVSLTAILALVSMAAASTGCASSQSELVDNVASEPELTQTQSDALLSRSDAVGVYESVGVAPASIGSGYLHEVVAIKADGTFRVERSFSSTPTGAIGATRIATGTWKIPFLRFNQIKLNQESNEALNAALGNPGFVLVDGERFKPKNGVLYNARAEGEQLARFCMQGCAKAAP